MVFNKILRFSGIDNFWLSPQMCQTSSGKESGCFVDPTMDLSGKQHSSKASLTIS